MKTTALLILALTVAKPLLAGPDSTKASFGGIPIVFWTPETRFIGGGLLTYSKEFPSRISIAVPAVWTQEKQFFAGFNLDVTWNGDIDRVRAEGQSTNFVEDFYGVGNDLPASGKERFTPLNSVFKLRYDRRLVGSVFGGLVYHAGSYRVTHARPRGILTAMGLTDAPSVELSGLGVAGTYDSRDNENSSRTGFYARVSAVRFDGVIASERNYTQLETDVRKFVPVGKSSVFAFQLYGLGTFGNAPIQTMALLGGPNVMRGYYPGRYRDQHLVSVQTEFRTQIVWRFSGAVFAGLGDVAHRIGDLRARDLKYSTGFGFRFALDKKSRSSLRLDIAFGKNSSAPSIAFNEAF